VMPLQGSKGHDRAPVADTPRFRRRPARSK
jgi:hypothetical protein